MSARSLAAFAVWFARADRAKRPVRPIMVAWAGKPLDGGWLACGGYGIEQCGLGTMATVFRVGPVVVVFGKDKLREEAALARRAKEAAEAECRLERQRCHEATHELSLAKGEAARLRAENKELRERLWLRPVGHA